ncbi:hypothetical protein OQA88_3776 [Cercophora sp. LCS_1]
MYGISARRIACAGQLGILTKRPATFRFSTSSLADERDWGVHIADSSAPVELPKPPPPPRNIAILGGGLTGLSSALFLSEALPKTKIIVYEGSGRTGGWIDGKRVKVKTPDGEEGTVLFERGARLVQVPSSGRMKLDDLPFWELVLMLNLTGELVGVPRRETLTKYIYFPDHLVKVPEPGLTFSNLWEMFRAWRIEPLFESVNWAVLHFMMNKSKLLPKESGNHRFYVPERDKQSLGEYFQKACGSHDLVHNMLSAVIHGVWGGDIWRLSDERAVPGHYDRPRLEPAYQEEWVPMSNEDTDLVFLSRGQNTGIDTVMTPVMNAYSHVWFRGGFNTLTQALREELSKRGVEVRNERVESLRHEGKTIRVLSKSVEGNATTPPVAEQYEKVISTINASALAKLAPPNALPTLADSHAVNIMAVNLWYPTPDLNHPHSGFGYLIPQGVPLDQSPEYALGVLFDSDREHAGIPITELCDPRPPQKGTSPFDTVPGTKFTVLMGGHFWDHIPLGELPTPEKAIEMAKSVVARHLGIPQHENDRAVASAKLCEGCIPQHYVGHWTRMAKARDELQAAFDGKLAVAGPSYQMPGILGSIRAAKDLTHWIAGNHAKMSVKPRLLSPVGPTGLERFATPRRWSGHKKEGIEWRYRYHGNDALLRRELDSALNELMPGKR